MGRSPRDMGSGIWHVEEGLKAENTPKMKPFFLKMTNNQGCRVSNQEGSKKRMSREGDAGFAVREGEREVRDCLTPTWPFLGVALAPKLEACANTLLDSFLLEFCSDRVRIDVIGYLHILHDRTRGSGLLLLHSIYQ